MTLFGPHINLKALTPLPLHHEGIELSYNEKAIFNIRGPFEKFVDWRQCAAVVPREVVTVMLSCGGGGNKVVA
jgi:hypothetical protein